MKTTKFNLGDEIILTVYDNEIKICVCCNYTGQITYVKSKIIGVGKGNNNQLLVLKPKDKNYYSKNDWTSPNYHFNYIFLEKLPASSICTKINHSEAIVRKIFNCEDCKKYEKIANYI